MADALNNYNWILVKLEDNKISYTKTVDEFENLSDQTVYVEFATHALPKEPKHMDLCLVNDLKFYQTFTKLAINQVRPRGYKNYSCSYLIKYLFIYSGNKYCNANSWRLYICE